MPRFKGIANASAAVALDANRFVVADDERKFLSVFSLDDDDRKPEKIRLKHILGERIRKEPDLEGAAAIGDDIYWIASHGTNEKGEPSAERQILFATSHDANSDNFDPRLKGEVYRTLLYDLYADSRYRAVLGMPGSLSIPPKTPGGISIEGLAADPDGEGELLIGFRNPLRENKAVVAAIRRPERLLAGGHPDFAEPILLDLGGRGIRSMERIGDGYLIVGGPIDDAPPRPALFHWTGIVGEDPRLLAADFRDGDGHRLNPEAVFAIPGTDNVCILSDDGGLYRGGNRLPGKPKFRAIILNLLSLIANA